MPYFYNRDSAHRCISVASSCFNTGEISADEVSSEVVVSWLRVYRLSIYSVSTQSVHVLMHVSWCLRVVHVEQHKWGVVRLFVPLSPSLYWFFQPNVLPVDEYCSITWGKPRH